MVCDFKIWKLKDTAHGLNNAENNQADAFAEVFQKVLKGGFFNNLQAEGWVKGPYRHEVTC